MALPDTIAVKYTEGEDVFLSVRPVVRQTFRLEELLDMVLAVTGKDVARIRQVLRSGTVVYHFHRYWWTGFEAESGDLAAALARFPEADPGRPFRAGECVGVVLERSAEEPRLAIELSREAASRRRLLRSGSFWAWLMALAEAAAPRYHDYSYARRADLYVRELSPPEVEGLVRQAVRLAPRALRAQFARLAAATRIVFVCPRGK